MIKSIKICPKCGSDSQIIETRLIKSGVVRRRRECLNCLHRWTTGELPYRVVQALLHGREDE